MHRFFIEGDLTMGHDVALSDRDSWHASRVLRLEPGVGVLLLNGEGCVCEATLAEVSRTRSFARPNLVRTVPASPGRVILVMALAKGRAMDWVIEKGTELGVSEMVFVPCRRSVAQVPATEAAEKTEKWRAASLEALKQCGGAWLPRISLATSLESRLSTDVPPPLRIVAALHPSARPLPLVLDAFFSNTITYPVGLEVWVGPEGDFTEAERELIVAAGVLPVSLGTNVLRCETAAIACASILQHEARRWGAAA